MTPRQIYDEASQAISFLVSSGLADDQNYPYLDSKGADSVVTFKNATQLNLALKHKPYVELYDELRSARVFSALLSDGAMLQLSYDYITNRLIRHRLAFFPCPNTRYIHEEPDLYLDETSYIELLDKSVWIVPLRFDFDGTDGVAVPLDHPLSHLTLGQFENCRIPVSAPVSPLQFLEFVLRCFYKTAFVKLSASFPVGTAFPESCLHLTESATIHVRIPVLS